MQLAHLVPTRTPSLLGVLIAGCLVQVSPAVGEHSKATVEHPAQVLFIGTFHFENPGRDVAKVDTIDIMSDIKQAEVLEVVGRLAQFRPTKVAIEATPDRAEEFNRLYQAFLRGEHQLNTNERQQLGFRVAATQRLERLHLIDHKGSFPIGPVMAYAQEHDPPFMQRFQSKIKRIEDEMNQSLRELSILEMLQRESLPSRIEQGQSMYVEAVELGAGDSFVGADLMTAWFERNVRIFANLVRLAEPDDRILVLFGAGHAYVMQDLIRIAPNLVLVDPAKYLGP